MNRQRQLNALLFELQSASSPLEQAKAIARAWRTIRELSPSDRRLLARHAGFDGAEQLLEGLARRGVGSAPSLLLQLLGELRQHDGKAVADLARSLGQRPEFAKPSPEDHGEPSLTGGDGDRDEVGDPADLASGPASFEEAAAGTGSPFKTVAAPEGLGGAGADDSPEELGNGLEAAEVTAGGTHVENDGGDDSTAEESEAATHASYSPIPPALPPLLQEWELLTEGPESVSAGMQAVATADQMPINQPPGVTAAAERDVERGLPVVERFLWLRRQLDEMPEGSAASRLQMVQAFPDGWQRRRAVVAILESGAVSSATDGLELIAALGRQLDRRWCLRVLLELMDLGGTAADRASELVPKRSSGGRLLRRVGISDARNSPPGRGVF